MQRRAIAAYLVLLAIFAGLTALPQQPTSPNRGVLFTSDNWAPLPRPYLQAAPPVRIKKGP